MDLTPLAAGLAMGLGAIGPGIGVGIAVNGAMNALGRNPDASGAIFVPYILGIALAEAIGIYSLVIGLLLAAFLLAWTYQIYIGMGAAGKRTPQMWAMYITTFVFWIGIGHAGTLISAVLYLFRARWRTSIYRAAEAMTIFAVWVSGIVSVGLNAVELVNEV